MCGYWNTCWCYDVHVWRQGILFDVMTYLFLTPMTESWLHDTRFILWRTCNIMMYLWRHDVFFMSWRILCYDVLLTPCRTLDVIKYFVRHDVFLTSWRNSDVMIFWRNNVCLDFMVYFLMSCTFEVMTYFWLHYIHVMAWRSFDVMTYFLKPWRTFWRHVVLFTSWRTFDVTAYFWRHVALFDVMTHVLMSLCTFDMYFWYNDIEFYSPYIIRCCLDQHAGAHRHTNGYQKQPWRVQSRVSTYVVNIILHCTRLQQVQRAKTSSLLHWKQITQKNHWPSCTVPAFESNITTGEFLLESCHLGPNISEWGCNIYTTSATLVELITSPPIGGGRGIVMPMSVCLCVCPCFRKISKCNISAISQPITMKFGTHTGGAAGEVCHLWLPCCKSMEQIIKVWSKL